MSFRRRAAGAVGLACLLAFAFDACSDPSTHGGSPKKGQRTAAHPTNSPHPSVDPTAPKAPPPVRKSHGTPPLPDLPALAAHDRVDTKHSKAQPGEFPCGGVSVSGRTIPVLCVEELKGQFEEAATALLPFGTVRPKSMHLPAIVDHRDEGTEGVVRAQGGAPTCSAFAFAAAADHSVARWSGTPAQTSVMEIWSRYHRTAESPAVKLNLEQPIGSESAWPYAENEAMSWLSPDSCRRWHSKVRCGKEPDVARERASAAKPVAEVRQVEVLRPPGDVDALRAKIAAGQDVVVGMTVGKTLRTAHAGNTAYVPDYEDTTGGHYVVLAGYAKLSQGAYFLAHNSWGEGWGDGGYAWIHEATLQRHVREAYVVDAQPTDAAAGARQRRVRSASTCSGDLVPDSITAQCAKKCPDGSPRHADVCAIASQCPDGYVNLTGSCALAAPKTSGKHDATGIKWACGPGGCAYWVPKGEGGCSGAICQISCPAPDFRIAKDKHGLTCVE